MKYLTAYTIKHSRVTFLLLMVIVLMGLAAFGDSTKCYDEIKELATKFDLGKASELKLNTVNFL